MQRDERAENKGAATVVALTPPSAVNYTRFFSDVQTGTFVGTKGVGEETRPMVIPKGATAGYEFVMANKNRLTKGVPAYFETPVMVSIQINGDEGERYVQHFLVLNLGWPNPKRTSESFASLVSVHPDSRFAYGPIVFHVGTTGSEVFYLSYKLQGVYYRLIAEREENAAYTVKVTPLPTEEQKTAKISTLK